MYQSWICPLRGLSTSAFNAMQSDDMDTNMLRRLVEALVNCLKHSTNVSVLMAVELMLAKRELTISGSKILTDASKDSLRSVPFSADSLFGGKMAEIQKVNSETHQQKLIADSVSQQPGPSQSQSSQFRTPRVPRKKGSSSRRTPGPFRKRVGKNNSRQMGPFCRKARLQDSFRQETDHFPISTVLQQSGSPVLEEKVQKLLQKRAVETPVFTPEFS